MDFNLITQTYNLETIGYPELVKQLDTVTKKFQEIKKAKTLAEGKILLASDTQDLKEYSAEVAKLKIEELQLANETKRLTNEIKANNLAKQAAINKTKEEAKAVKAAAGSYNDLLQQQKELYKLVRNTPKGSPISFQGQTLQFDQAIAKLKQLSAAEQDFRRQFAKDGLLVAEYASGIRKGFGGIGDIGKNITASIGNTFDKLKGQLAGFVVGIVGAQAAFSQLNKTIQTTAEVSDLTTELEINLGLAAGGADRLVESLKKIDTRTSLKGLLEIADVALKAGVSNENLLGVTESIDKVKTAFGKDFGDVSTGTDTLAKLISIFFQDGQITAERVLAVGNSIRTIANESAASVPFLTDFSQRMAGVKQIANVSLPDILGLGAGFQQFGQSAETTSTALVKIIPKLGADTQRFAKILGITREQFSELVNTNPAEALLQISSALVGNKNGIEEVSAALADSELGSGRITSVIATLGGHVETFRERITSAGKAFQDTGAITDAFNRKNNNLAATFDKINKKFSDLAGNKKFQDFLSNISGLLFGLIGVITNIPFPLLIAGLTLSIALTKTWVGEKLRLLVAFALERTAMLIEAGQLAVNNGLRAASNVLLNIYTASILRSATASGIAAVAYRILAGAITFLTGPLGIAVGLIVAFTTVIGLISANAKSATSATKDLALSQAQLAAQARVNAALSEKIAASIGDQVARIKQLTALTKDQNVSDKTRKTALEELIKLSPKYREALQGESIDIGKVTEASEELIASLQKQAKAKAVAELAAEKEREKFQLESKLSALGPSDVNNEIGAGAFLQNIGSAIGIGKGTRGQRIRDIQNELTTVNSDLEAIYKMVGTNNDIQNAIVDQFKKGAILGDQDDKKTKESRLSPVQKDLFKDIEAIRDRLNAVDEKKRAENLVDEESYLDLILANNLSAINQKLKLLKGSNAEERRVIAQLQLEKVKLETETNEKIFDVKEKLLNDQLQFDLKQIDNNKNIVLDDINATETEKAQAQLDADNAELTARENHYNALLTLNDNFNAAALQKSQAALDDTKKQRQKDQDKISLATLQDLKDQAEVEIRGIETNFSIQRKAILDNQNLTAKQKEQQLEQLEAAQKRTILSAELNQLLLQLEAKKFLLGLSLISDKDYLKSYAEFVKKAEELSNTISDEDGKTKEKLTKRFSDLKTFLQESLRNVFKLEEDSRETQLLGDIVAQSYDLALEAMNNFYSAERQRIQDNLDVQLQRLDIEKEQVIVRAQSQAEIDSIERQYAAKKKIAEREAGEKLKKSRRSEAKIALAAELANIAVAAAGNPANAFTFGAAGAIMYGILSGLAIARYALRVAEINKEQFEYGGRPGNHVPTRGGRFKGKPHSKGGTPFGYQGEQFEAEVDELAIIRTKDAPGNKRYNISGTHTEIASALNTLGGGVNFRTGAKIRKMEKGALLKEQETTNELRTKNKVIHEKLSITKDKDVTLRLNQEKETNERISSEKIFKIRKELIERDRELLIKKAERNFQRVERSFFTTSEEKQVANEHFISNSIAIERRYSNLMTLLESSFNKTVTVKTLPVHLRGKAAKFEKGGIPLRGGEFGGMPHGKGGTPFIFRGRQYEAEVDELAVIRTRNAPRNKRFKVEGTQMEIASAINRIGGGVDFKPGASVKKFDTGGYIGQNLQAPVFTPNSSVINNIGGGMSRDQFNEMLNRMDNIASEQSKRVDRIEVVQQTQTVTNAQKKAVKNYNIGTL